MNAEIRRRLKWVKLYEELRDAGVVCRRCGISRPTVRKWVKRYPEDGEAGLNSMSRRPHRSPHRKITKADQATILRMRGENKGARRIQSELRLYEQKEWSLRTIHKVLVAAEVKPLVKPKRPILPKRYSLLIPGERVQMDTMKVAPGVYQYTAVDDCSRFRVLAVYPGRDARDTLLFLERVIEEMPFPIQRIQTDRGTAFFAESVQKYLMSQCIKFRPIPPRSPHLNGKVERSQLTDKVEFWSRYSPKAQGIDERIQAWQFEYNWRRPHGSLSGKTPAGKLTEVSEQTPFSEEVALAYDVRKERIRYSDWKVDCAIAATHLQRENNLVSI